MACNPNSLVEGLQGGDAFRSFEEVGSSGENQVETGKFIVLNGVDQLAQNFQ